MGPTSVGKRGECTWPGEDVRHNHQRCGRPGPLLRADILAEFTKLHSRGIDLVTGERDHFLLGFEAQHVRYPFLGADAFGHSGAVGAQAFADPRSGIAYSYTRRRFSFGGGGGARENHRLAAAVLRAATHDEAIFNLRESIGPSKRISARNRPHQDFGIAR